VLDLLGTHFQLSKLQLLVAQIDPASMFGSDIFADYIKLSPNRSYTGKFDLPVIFDEIQLGLQWTRALSVQDTKLRSVLSSLVLYLKPLIVTFVWMGTGIQYHAVTDLVESMAGKLDTGLGLEDYNGFTVLNADNVRTFTRKVLSHVDDVVVEEIIEVILREPMCIGRARFAALVIDAAIENPTLSSVVDRIDFFRGFLGNPNNDYNPLRFVRDNPGWKTIAVHDHGIVKTLESVLLDSCLQRLTRGTFVISVDAQSSADLVSKGIGFRESVQPETGRFDFFICEPAIVYAINRLFSAKVIALSLLNRLESQPTSSAAGYWFEYLVAVAIWAKHGNTDGPITISKDINLYLSSVKDGQPGDMILLPDPAMGPDIIYWDGSQFIIVQVKLRKLCKPDVLRAADTTDLQNFYKVRGSSRTIKGYEKIQEIATRTMRNRQIMRVLVCSQMVNNVPQGVMVFQFDKGPEGRRKSPRYQLFENLIRLNTPISAAQEDDNAGEMLATQIWERVRAFESS
jgi:hypothetical protein